MGLRQQVLEAAAVSVAAQQVHLALRLARAADSRRLSRVCPTALVADVQVVAVLQSVESLVDQAADN